MRVKGGGPVPAEVLLCGEAPGKQEEQSGQCFVGKSGQELDRILMLGGVYRQDVYVTNVVKERPPFVNGKQQPPSAEDIARDEEELIQELVRVRPKWIGALGRVAARWFTGLDLDMESSWGLSYPLSVRLREVLRAQEGSPHPSNNTRVLSGVAQPLVQEAHVREGTRETAGGLPPSARSDVLTWADGGEPTSAWVDDIRVIPLYHPAAGMHNADLAQFVWRGLQLFTDYVNGAVLPVSPTDHFPSPAYARGVSDGWGVQDGLVACDTEGLPGTPWGLSFTAEPGRATVLRYSSDPAQFRFDFNQARVIFHNSLHDVPILEEMGVPVDWENVEDTFLMAYVLRLVPMGLKALSRRFCGMEMQSYLDVVAPADRKLASEWITGAFQAARCPVCAGVGKVPAMRKDGKGFLKNPVKCTGPGCIDGGLWEARDEQLKYDWDTGNWKLSRGWSVNKYLNELQKDLDAGKFEMDPETGELKSVRTRVMGWPDDVVEIISRKVGELPEPTLDDIDPDAATYYSARDADATMRIYPILAAQVDQLGLREAYRLDLSVIPVAAEMQRNGMYVDKEYFAKFTKELERDNEVILARLEKVCGKPLNPASGDQVAGLLFGEKKLDLSQEDVRTLTTLSWDLEPTKLTKSGKRASVDDKVLEALKLKHAENKELVGLIDLILDYRIRDKILGTYARKMPRLADENGFVHTTIKPCRTATFRWSSADPNLQNIPARPKNGVDLGKKVRMGFVAPPGYVLGSWDFDQIEMRVLAWYSQDANLLRIFREGLDIHSMTAALVFRVPFEQFVVEMTGPDKKLAVLRKDQRGSAKNIGFGVVYGVTAKGLKAQMELRGQHWTEEQCQELIDLYLYQAYPGVGMFMSDAHAEARRNGYVRSLFGHIRYVPGVHSSVASVREEALRQAANFKIQCTAAELLKLAMRTLWVDYKPVLDSVGSKLLMAVHDELLLMVPDNSEARSITDTVVTEAMTNPYPMDGVHVGTTGKFDYNWGLLK